MRLLCYDATRRCAPRVGIYCTARHVVPRSVLLTCLATTHANQQPGGEWVIHLSSGHPLLRYMTIVSTSKGFAFEFQVLNPSTVAITKYPLKGCKGWPASTSVSRDRARTIAQSLKQSA